MVNIGEIRQKVFIRDMFTCQKCGCRDQDKLSLAHRIKSGKYSENYIIKYMMQYFKFSMSRQDAKEILYHPDNLVVACNGSCNDSYNIFNQPVQRDTLMIAIFKKVIQERHKEIA